MEGKKMKKQLKKKSLKEQIRPIDDVESINLDGLKENKIYNFQAEVEKVLYDRLFIQNVFVEIEIYGYYFNLQVNNGKRMCINIGEMSERVDLQKQDIISFCGQIIYSESAYNYSKGRTYVRTLKILDDIEVLYSAEKYNNRECKND